MRSFFLAHGSPMNAISDNSYVRFLKDLGSKLSPQAVIVATAHWESSTQQISRVEGAYSTLYDFYGFPKELHAVTYPAQGSPQLADSLIQTLEEHGFPAQANVQRGLDHGAWSLLVHLFPQANVPVVQMSVDPRLNGQDHIHLGQAIGSLKGENLVFIGSGVSVHNLAVLDESKELGDAAEDWAVAFDDWLLEHSSLDQLDSLAQWMQKAPHMRKAAPTIEHFIPYLLARGAGAMPQAQLLHRSYEMGSLSYLCMEF